MVDLYFGSYTSGRHRGEGVTHTRYDSETGRIEIVSHTSGLASPSYLAWNDDKTRLFAVGEGGVSAMGEFKRSENGALELVRRVDLSSGLCHLAHHHGSVYLASYGLGELWEVPPQGAAKRIEEYEGSGPDLTRQTSSHAHQIVVSPEGDRLLVPDLGADKVWIHPITPKGVQKAVGLDTPPGFGPRHLVSHPSLPRFYVLGELAGKILTCEWGVAPSMGAVADSYSGQGAASSAAIKVSPDGKVLAASHRGDDSIALHPLDENGGVGAARRIVTGGENPRDFAFDPVGKRLVVGHQNTDQATVIDIASGEIVSRATVPSAVCVLFA